jgi:hypothetical protein
MTQLDRLEQKVDHIARLLTSLLQSLAEDEDTPPTATLDGLQVGQRDDTKSLG